MSFSKIYFISFTIDLEFTELKNHIVVINSFDFKIKKILLHLICQLQKIFERHRCRVNLEFQQNTNAALIIPQCGIFYSYKMGLNKNFD